MESFNIKNWQDNVAEDIVNKKLVYEENLINSILECAYQLAKLREALHPGNFFSNTNSSGKIDFPHFPRNFTVTIPDLPKIPKKYLNDAGEVDLSKVTGEEAREYFIKFLGLKFPVGVTRQIIS